MHWRFVGNLLSLSKLDHQQKVFSWNVGASVPDCKALYHKRQRCVTSLADTQPILTFTNSQSCKRNFFSPWNFKVLLHYDYSLFNFHIFTRSYVTSRNIWTQLQSLECRETLRGGSWRWSSQGWVEVATSPGCCLGFRDLIFEILMKTRWRRERERYRKAWCCWWDMKLVYDAKSSAPVPLHCCCRV